MAFNPRFTITNPIADALTRVERARGFLEAAKRWRIGFRECRRGGWSVRWEPGPKNPTKYYQPVL